MWNLLKMISWDVIYIEENTNTGEKSFIQNFLYNPLYKRKYKYRRKKQNSIPNFEIFVNRKHIL